LALFLVAAAACPAKTTAYATVAIGCCRIFGLPELQRRSLCIGTPMHAKSLALDFNAALLASRSAATVWRVDGTIEHIETVKQLL